MNDNAKTGRMNRVPGILLSIYFLCLMLAPVVSIVAFMCLVIYFLIDGGYRRAWPLFRRDRVLWLFAGYFILHVIGLAYSDNMRYGLNDIQTKLTFLLVPVVFSGLLLTRDVFTRIKDVFIFSCAVSVLILFSISFVQYSHTGNTGNFFYIRLSHGFHVTYLSIYLNLALLFIEEKLFRKDRTDKRVLLLLAFAVIFIGILFLSARTSTVTAIATTIAFPVLQARAWLFRSKMKNIFFAIVIAMPVLFMLYLNLFNRFTQVEQEIERKDTTEAATIAEEPNSTNIRMNLWTNAVQLIGRHPLFGVGTGDIKEELVKIYSENNYEYGVRERISPHNQFLHTGVILGLAGMTVLALYFLLPLRLAFVGKDWLYFIFLLMILLNCMTESILERQAGILFFTAFNTCFYLRLRHPAE